MYAICALGKGEIKMVIEIVGEQKDIALVKSDELLITDLESALGLIVKVRYDAECHKIILEKPSVNEDFFKLSTKLAGDVLQKFVNYDMKLAVVGDYSSYTSKPLQDFIAESNRGNVCFFVSTLQEAVDKLSKMK
jgi:hypothetical protein